MNLSEAAGEENSSAVVGNTKMLKAALNILVS